MRRLLLSLLAVGVLISIASPADAWWRHCRTFHHVRHHYVHFNWSWRSYCPPVRTYVHYHRPIYFQPSYYYCPPRYIYTPPYCYNTSYIDPYVVNYNPQSNFVNYRLPAVYQPAELAYGPQAVKQFMGLPRDVGNAPLVQPRPLFTPAPAAAPAVQVREVKTSNPSARQRAARYLEFGDELFRSQRYHEALQRYKSAAAAAPDMAEPFFRQGHALVASNRFELAADAFKRAISLQPADLDRGGFQLDEIYGNSRLAKNAHVEALARTALARPQDDDMLFLVGLFLRYDGQADRSRTFFEKAQLLAGGDDAHLRPFMPRPPADVTRIANLGR